jgi:hypothetical protein
VLSGTPIGWWNERAIESRIHRAEVFGKEKDPIRLFIRRATMQKTMRNFSGYKAKTGIPYTRLYLHEARGIYGPKTLEIPG